MLSRRGFIKAGTVAVGALGLSLSGVPTRAKGDSESTNNQAANTPLISENGAKQEAKEQVGPFTKDNITIQRVRYRERGVENVRERVALLVDITNILKEPTGFSGNIEVYSYKMHPSAYLNGEPVDEPRPSEIQLVSSITKDNLVENLTGAHGGTLETVDKDTRESKKCDPGVLFFPISPKVHTDLSTSLQGNGPDNSRNIDPQTIQEGGGVYVYINRNYRTSGITLDSSGNLSTTELEYGMGRQMFNLTKTGVEEIPREFVGDEYNKLQTRYMLDPAPQYQPPLTPDYGSVEQPTAA